MSPSRTQPSAQRLYRRPAVEAAEAATVGVAVSSSAAPQLQQVQHQPLSPVSPPPTHHPQLQQPSHYDKHQRLEGPGTPLGNPVSIALDARKLSPSGNVQVQTSPPTNSGAAPTSASSSAAPSASGTPNTTPTRRRTQGLRSPVVKRPPGAPVTMQGWLHKQGSDGLMLWRKRWFVLCDYCLFYYKGPEEEKLLGSILLPSYTISACTTDNNTSNVVGVSVGVGRGGVGRKFAFKAEHANMRTYYFAADSHALMLQWMHALSLASLVQDRSSYEDSRRINYNSNQVNIQNMNFDDNESGFATYRPRQQQQTYGHQVQPQSPQQQLSLNFHQKQLMQQQQHGMTNGWRPVGMDPRQLPQHLYANAPPKPRRMANEDNPADSSSPDWSSPDGPPMIPLSHFQQAERRTPDTYGRSLAATPAPPSGSMAPPGPAPGLPQITRAEDYEDVFNERAWANQRDRPGQLAYLQTSSKTRATIITESLQTTYHRQQKRPRSADFLDYDARRYGVHSPDRDITGSMDQPSYQLPSVPSSHTLGRLQSQAQTAQPQQPTRPKSSLDTSFWSEESYAQEMRETAYLLQARSPQSSTQPLLPMSQSVQQLQQHQQQQRQFKLLEEEDLLLQRRWSEYADLRTGERSGDGTQPFLRSASARLPRRYRGPEDDSDDDRDGRGSSGSSVHYQQRRNSASGDRKVQQREESMKRLLEWKQRMLQSPLSRKPSESSSRGVNAVQNQLSNFYRQQVLRELATQEARAKEIAERDAEALAQAEQENTRIQLQNTTLEDRTNSSDSWNLDNHIPRSRNVATNRAMQLDVARNSRKKLQEEIGRPALRSRSQEGRRSSNSSRFNSYSSDDEELGDVRESRRRSRRPSRRNSSSASAAATTTAASGSSPTSAANASANAAPDYENVAMLCSAGRSSNILPAASPPAAPDSGYDTLQTSTAAQLDESRIVREFSYQYIKHPKVGEEAEKPSPPPPPPKQPKSVKDLLADFERKSEQVRQQQAAEERRDGEAAVAKRGVFSDTETLLYDTSSEAEPERDHRAPPAPVETLLPPPPPPQSAIPPPDEEHYMPMTPSKKALPEALFKNIFGSSVDVDMEESSYVEMTTGGLTRSLLAPTSMDSNVTSIVISNTVGTLTTTSVDSALSRQGDQSGDHGFSSSGGSNRHYEPVYMEVSATGSELSTSVAAPSPRPALPDILTMQPASGQTKSDSSDADDEASKDLDSLDTPRPRFSLSDTFRPASYYLGAELSAPSGGGNGDHPDSSDSDLVSPPPIPLDELETSLEAEPPQRPRRRPPSGSDLDLDSVGSRSGLDGESVDLDLDKYLGGYLRAFHKERYSLNENLAGPEKGNAPIKSFTASPLPPPLQEVLYENLPSPPSPPPQTPPTPPPPLPEPTREIRQTSPSTLPQSEPLPQNSSQQQETQYPTFQQRQGQEETPQQQQQSAQTPNHNHHHQSSSQSQQTSPSSAPYYYSDLLKPGTNTVLDTSTNPSRQRHAPLNNQRDDVSDLSKRNDIGRRVNPINHGLQGSSPSPPASPAPVAAADEEGRRLAEEVRSTSVHFLGADKCSRVDRRNLYEADTLQRRRACTASGLSAPGQHNLFPQGIRDKSRSLEGLLDDATPMDQEGGTGIIDRLLRGAAPSELAAVALTVRSSQSAAPPPSQNDPLWEEDALWRENLRRASLRHTRSMDDLDEPSASGRRRRVSRDVTYVNEQRHGGALSRREYEEDYREGRRARPPNPTITSTPVAPSPADDGVHYERLARFSTESLERTRRGQTFLDGYAWDADRETFYKNEPFLESCPPPPSQVPDASSAAGQSSIIAPLADPPPPPPEPRPTSPVSSLVGRDPVGEEDLLGNGGIVGSRTPLLPLQPLCSSQPTLPPPSSDSRDSGQISRSSTVDLLSGVVDLSNNNSNNNNLVNGSLSPTSEDWRNRDFRDSWQARNQNKRRGGSSPSSGGGGAGGGGEVGGGYGEPFSLQVSAGELLGRTHEELVLLLIQLRRASAAVCKAMETCHVEIEAQARLAELETPRRVEHLHKLDELKRQLQELEKQYEKGKPLVNLVDNMVKLGSLYREGVSPYSVGLHSPSTPSIDPLPLRQRLEFNHKVQEQRLLAEERRDWDRLSLDHSQLQAKVQHLYRLDQLMREESGTLQSLQQDKELLERALGGLRHKLQAAHTRPAEAEQYRKQQRLLERELSRVRLLLAHNSKKLEETVAENARLEQELVILRQKLQASRQPYYSASACVSPATSMLGGFHDSPPSPATPTTPTAVLEAELRRVQRLVGDLQRQRQELSLAVRQLTEKSNTLSEQIRPGPTGVAGAGPILGRKRQQSSWLETDLDSLVTRDLGTESQQTSPTEGQSTSTPLYVNTELALSSTTNGGTSNETTFNSSTSSDPLAYAQIELSEADDRMKRFYGIIPREKQQEIKTVRIVKRESERRQRDRDRSGNVGIPLLGTTGAKRTGFSDEHLDSTLLGQVLESEETTPLRQTTSSQALDEAMARLDDELHSAIGTNSSTMGPPRSMSLPRGFGKTNSAGLEVDSIPSFTTSLRSSSPRIDSGAAMRNAMLRKQRVRFDPTAGSGSESSTGSTSANRTLSAREQLFGSGVDDHTLLAIGSRDPSPQLSPVYSNHSVYQSEVARQIVMEMKGTTPPMSKMSSTQLLNSKPQDLEQKEEEKEREKQETISQENGLSTEQPQGAVRRAVPREKRRHHTVSSSRPLSHTSSSAFPSMQGYARSRDDLDMERALRPRLNAPDVVRSTLSRRTPRYDADTIDSLLGTPGKIHIPERYVPENEPALTREEQLQRIRKADAIRKMLTETRSSTTLPTKSPGEDEDEEEEPSSTLKKKMEQEKKQREHLLQLNQILAKQVMEKSKLVAAKAMAEQTPASEPSGSEEDLSPATPLPLYQQRDNFYS